MADNDTKELQWSTMMLNNVEQLGKDMRKVSNDVASLASESRSMVKILERVESSIDKLERRDDILQQGVDALNVTQGRTETALTILSGNAHATDVDVKRHERKLVELDENCRHLNERVMSIGASVEKLRVSVDEGDRAFSEWEPWAKAIKWVIIGIAAVIVTALAVWFLRGFAQGIVTGGIV